MYFCKLIITNKKMVPTTQEKFLTSVLSTSSSLHTIDEILDWIRMEKQKIKCDITQIPINDLKQWYFDNESGSLRHASGKFFSVDGVRVNTNFGLKTTWDQPIINQPEIGFLGILTQMQNGVLHFLLQAKIEPGNINIVQLSPTLQATKSNYTRVHKGVTPAYLEYFNGERKVKVLVDQLQSEQGARFFRKRNRNIIIEIPEDENIEVLENFTWLTLRQIKELMVRNNLVNMDTRTVISSINYGCYKDVETLVNSATNISISETLLSHLALLLSSENSLFSTEEIISWLTELKSFYELRVEKIHLNDVHDWVFDGNTIHHLTNKYFSVIGTHVQISNREVQSWDQPMLKPAQEGIIGFIVKKINGVYHFLVQAKVEIGSFDILEIAPTVQCLTGNYRDNEKEYVVPFIEYFLDSSKGRIIQDSLQSEEGGRFFHEENRNMIIEVDDSFPTVIPKTFTWMTLSQLLLFMKFNNYLNIATRSLISLIPFNNEL